MKALLDKNWRLYLLLIAFAVFAFSFSFNQSLWVDEATQLSGLTLPINEIYLWLSGVDADRFLVPHDRMPILSYATGKVWQAVFGNDPITMRFLSILFVVISLIFFVSYARRSEQNTSLLYAFVLLTLSPNLTIYAVEIRAYGLFFALSLVSCLLFIDILKAINEKTPVLNKALLLSTSLALAINTHFFGIVLTGSIISSLILSSLIYPGVKTDKKILFTSLAIIALAIMIAYPQINFSAGASGSASAQNIDLVSSIIVPAVKLVYRLVAHQTMAGNLFIDAIAIVIVYGIILFSLVKKITPLKIAMTAVLVAGVFAALGAKIISSKFDALSPQYNIWMLPFLTILFGICLADCTRKLQIISISLLSLCFLYGQYNLLTDGPKYAHTRFNTLEKLIVEHTNDRSDASVIYHAKLGKTWIAGLYKLDDEISQYVANGSDYRNLKTGVIVDANFIENNSKFIFAISGQDIFSNELAISPLETTLSQESNAFKIISLNQQQWNMKHSKKYFAQESGEIVVFEKNN